MRITPAGSAPGRWRALVGLALSMLSLSYVGLFPAFQGCGNPQVPASDELLEASERADWPRVAKLAREALRKTPNDPAGLRWLARASIKTRRFEVAQGIYDRLGARNMESLDRAVLAEMLVDQGESDAGLRVLEEGRGTGREHPEALRLLVGLLIARDRLADAQGLAEQLAREAGPFGVEGNLRLAQIAQLETRFGDSVDWLRRALELEQARAGPRVAEIGTRLAQSLLSAGRFEEALRALNAIPEKLTPRDFEYRSRAQLHLGKIEQARADLELAADPARNPLSPDPGPYAGAAACATCHKAIFESQQTSHHSTTIQSDRGLSALPVTDQVIEDPANPGVSYRMSRDAQQRLTLTSDQAGRQASLRAEYAFGSGDRGATPVGRDADGKYRELRLSYYQDKPGWDVTTGHPRVPDCSGQAGDPSCFLGRPLSVDGLRRCFDCHTTQGDAARLGIEPMARDRGIGCERCHGPAGNHVAAMNVVPAFPDLAIARPALASPRETVAVCAQCHSPRGVKVRRDDPASIRFQATTLTWSPCFEKSQGEFGCVTCHDPHRDAVTDSAYYVGKCLTCHAADAAARPAHAAGDGAREITLPPSFTFKPCPVNATEGCIECHMPTRVNALPHTKFTDHFIRVHREDGPAAGR